VGYPKFRESPSGARADSWAAPRAGRPAGVGETPLQGGARAQGPVPPCRRGSSRRPALPQTHSNPAPRLIACVCVCVCVCVCARARVCALSCAQVQRALVGGADAAACGGAGKRHGGRRPTVAGPAVLWASWRCSAASCRRGCASSTSRPARLGVVAGAQARGPRSPPAAARWSATRRGLREEPGWRQRPPGASCSRSTAACTRAQRGSRGARASRAQRTFSLSRANWSATCL